MPYRLNRPRGRLAFCLLEFRSGSHESFSKIYGCFAKPILRYVKGRLSNHVVAEELTQEIFLKAFRFRESYDEKYSFSTWLWSIAKNTVFDHLRSVKRTDLLHEAEDKIVPLDEIPTGDLDAESAIIKKDDRKNILRMMRVLTRSQKRALWMRIIHQRSYQEISERLGLSLSAAKNLVYRAKLNLADPCYSY